MKNLKIYHIIMGILFCNLVTIQAMEVRGKNLFLKMPLEDIYEWAEDFTQLTGVTYQMVKTPNLFVRYLETLGLTPYNTPLDIRYHYDLLIQKLSKDDPLYNKVRNAYKELMLMFLDFANFQMDLQQLLTMKFDQIEAMELEDVSGEKYQFIRDKGQLIKNIIGASKKNVSQQVVNKPTIRIVKKYTIQALLHLPAYAPHSSIDEAYNNYMEKNSAHKLIALQKINKLSKKELKNRLLELEKVKETYSQYIKQHPGIIIGQ